MDVILDMVGGEYIAKNLKCLNEDGRLVQIAFLQGAKAEVNFAHLMMRRLTFTGSIIAYGKLSETISGKPYLY